MYGQNQSQSNNEYARVALGGTPTPVAAIPNATGVLAASTERLHGVITQLAQRLESVLAPQPPAGVSETSKNARHSLALLIEAEATKVHGAADRLEAILSRLEV